MKCMPSSFNSIIAASCVLFSSILCYNTSFFSVPRLLSLSLNIPQDGGSRHNTSAFPNYSFPRVFLISFIPYKSTSIRGRFPAFRISKQDCLLVPYQFVKTRLLYNISPLSARVENSSLLMKQQCFPWISPCLGGRVVKLRTNWRRECLLRSEDMTVPLPTPEGPITINDFIQQSQSYHSPFNRGVWLDSSSSSTSDPPSSISTTLYERSSQLLLLFKQNCSSSPCRLSRAENLMDLGEAIFRPYRMSSFTLRKLRTTVITMASVTVQNVNGLFISRLLFNAFRIPANLGSSLVLSWRRVNSVLLSSDPMNSSFFFFFLMLFTKAARRVNPTGLLFSSLWQKIQTQTEPTQNQCGHPSGRVDLYCSMILILYRWRRKRFPQT